MQNHPGKSLFSLLTIVALYSCSGTPPEGPYLATGIKIGEVTQHEAIVWVRLTEIPQRIGNDAPMPEVKYRDPETGEMRERQGRPNREPHVRYPDGYTLKTIQGAAPGRDGYVRLKYRVKDAPEWVTGEGHPVDPARDYTHQFRLEGLEAGREYELRVEASPLENGTVSASIEGGFKTAPDADMPAEVNFIVTTGTSYPDVDSETGYRFYSSALKLDPEFFVHTGDIVYYDGMGKSAGLARWHWDRMYSYPNNIDFHRQVSSYFIKDDHDTWMNDCYPGMETRFMGELTYEQGTRIFLEEVPMGPKTYRTIRWGKDLQIWLVEGRDYRSPNPMPDGPGKTIWGKEQMQWFQSTVEASDATFKILISPTPIVGPDRQNKNDNHANQGFKYEGDLLRRFLAGQKNMVSVCGDRHWQYISKDADTGLLEFSCGPGSDEHAGGWSQEDRRSEHVYLNVAGGFMEGAVLQTSEGPSLVFRHYNPDGELNNEYVLERE